MTESEQLTKIYELCRKNDNLLSKIEELRTRCFELLQENAQLKELLKECKHIMTIEKDFASCHFEKDKLCKLLTKINQVLGDK